MFHLVEFNYCIPRIVRSSIMFNTLLRFVNGLRVPLNGLSFEIYDKNGACMGRVIRDTPHRNCIFIKSPLYERKSPSVIYYAYKPSEMDAYSSYILDRFYPESAGSDVVRFYAENRD